MNSEQIMQKGPLIISKLSAKKNTQINKFAEHQKSMNLNSYHEVSNKGAFAEIDTPTKSQQVNKSSRLMPRKTHYQYSPEIINRRVNYQIQTPEIGGRKHLNRSEVISSTENTSTSFFPHPPVFQHDNTQNPSYNSNSSGKSRKFQGKRVIQSHHNQINMSLLEEEDNIDSFSSVLKCISYKKDNTRKAKQSLVDSYEEQKLYTNECKGKLTRAPRGVGGNMYCTPSTLQKELINKGSDCRKNKIGGTDLYSKEWDSSLGNPNKEHCYNSKLETFSGNNLHLISLHKVCTGEEISPKKNNICGK